MSSNPPSFGALAFRPKRARSSGQEEEQAGKKVLLDAGTTDTQPAPASEADKEEEVKPTPRAPGEFGAIPLRTRPLPGYEGRGDAELPGILGPIPFHTRPLPRYEESEDVDTAERSHQAEVSRRFKPMPLRTRPLPSYTGRDDADTIGKSQQAEGTGHADPAAEKLADFKARYIKQIMLNWNIESKSEILPPSVTPRIRREDFARISEVDIWQNCIKGVEQPLLEPEEWSKELIDAVLRLSRVVHDRALAHRLLEQQVNGRLDYVLGNQGRERLAGASPVDVERAIKHASEAKKQFPTYGPLPAQGRPLSGYSPLPAQGPLSGYGPLPTQAPLSGYGLPTTGNQHKAAEQPAVPFQKMMMSQKTSHITAIMTNWNIQSKSHILPLTITPRREQDLSHNRMNPAGSPFLAPEEWPTELLEELRRLSRLTERRSRDAHKMLEQEVNGGLENLTVNWGVESLRAVTFADVRKVVSRIGKEKR